MSVPSSMPTPSRLNSFRFVVVEFTDANGAVTEIKEKERRRIIRERKKAEQAIEGSSFRPCRISQLINSVSDKVMVETSLTNKTEITYGEWRRLDRLARGTPSCRVVWLRCDVDRTSTLL